MEKGKLLDRLEREYLEYKQEAKDVKEERGWDNSYWNGKASGVLLAIEIIQGKI